jgi:hypothetical protein
MLPFLFAFTAIAQAAAPAAHPLCPFNEVSARARTAPAARSELAGLKDVFADFETRFGKCRAVTEAEVSVFRFAAAEVPWRVSRDKKGRWTSFSFGPARFPADTPAKLLADAKAAGAALFVQQEAGGMLSASGEEELEAGETAHLVWLAEYRKAVAAGKLKPASIVETKQAAPGLLALGPLLSWPAGVPLSLESAALLAFRSRDNLAADLLLESIGFKVAGRETAPYGKLAIEGNPHGWRHSPRALCAAALSLKDDTAFPEGLSAAEGRNRFYEFQGEFPRTYAVVHLSQAVEKGPYTCAAVIFPQPKRESYTRARDFLDRGFDLRGHLPQDPLVKAP